MQITPGVLESRRCWDSEIGTAQTGTRRKQNWSTWQQPGWLIRVIVDFVGIDVVAPQKLRLQTVAMGQKAKSLWPDRRSAFLHCDQIAPVP